MIKKLLELPSLIYYEKVQFEMKLFKNAEDELRLCYEIAIVENDSKHWGDWENYGCWYNPFLEGNKSFLYLVEGINNDEKLIIAVNETICFLRDHALI